MLPGQATRPSYLASRAVARIFDWRGSACRLEGVSLWSASEVRASAPIKLRQGSGGAASGKFLGNFTS